MVEGHKKTVHISEMLCSFHGLGQTKLLLGLIWPVLLDGCNELGIPWSYNLLWPNTFNANRFAWSGCSAHGLNLGWDNTRYNRKIGALASLDLVQSVTSRLYRIFNMSKGCKWAEAAQILLNSSSHWLEFGLHLWVCRLFVTEPIFLGW